MFGYELYLDSQRPWEHDLPPTAELVAIHLRARHLDVYERVRGASDPQEVQRRHPKCRATDESGESSAVLADPRTGPFLLTDCLTLTCTGLLREQCSDQVVPPRPLRGRFDPYERALSERRPL